MDNNNPQVPPSNPQQQVVWGQPTQQAPNSPFKALSDRRLMQVPSPVVLGHPL